MVTLPSSISGANTAASVPKPLTQTQRLQKQQEEDRAASRTTKAESSLTTIIKNDEVVDALETPLSQYIPVTTGQVTSLLWAFLNPQDNSAITKKDVEFAIDAVGGSKSDADSLWEKLDPEDTGKVTSAQFVTGKFISGFVDAHMTDVQTSIDDLRFKNIIEGSSVSTGSILDYLGANSGTGTMLDGYA